MTNNVKSGLTALPLLEDLAEFSGLSGPETQLAISKRIDEYQQQIAQINERILELKSIHNAVTPFHKKLPSEILIHIFRHIEPKARQHIRLSHVCGLWRSAIHQAPEFWVDILRAVPVIGRPHGRLFFKTFVERTAPLNFGLSLHLRSGVMTSSRLPLLTVRLSALPPTSSLPTVATWRPYLNIERAPLRAAVARLMASEHPFAVEALRHAPYNIPRERRVCRFCKHRLCVEDEIHILFVCNHPLLMTPRELLFRQLYDGHSVNLPYILQFSPMSPGEVLHILLHREDAVLTMVAQFVHDMFHLVQITPMLVIRSDEEWAELTDPMECQL